jgi:putative CocE/NonD family hydrolase
MLGWRAGIQIQNDTETRPDVLLFTGDPLTADLEVTGPVSAVLHVGTTAPNTDFTVKLVDVHPDGKAYNVADGYCDAAIRRGNVSHQVTVELAPTSMLFRAGHRLRVEISSSNFRASIAIPIRRRYCPGDEAHCATQTLFLGGDTPSRLILPVVPR